MTPVPVTSLPRDVVLAKSVTRSRKMVVVTTRFAIPAHRNTGRAKRCSLSCRNAATAQQNTGRPGLAGAQNPAWKGGISKDNYRYKKLQLQRYPDRIKARVLVHRAVKAGRLQKEPCAKCGREPTFAHHHDYANSHTMACIDT